MNEIKWPLFEDLEQAFFVATTPISPSYIHGLITGLLCVTDTEQVRDEIHQKIQNFDESDKKHKWYLIENLMLLTQESLSQLDKPLILMLPEADLPLSWRLETLADWCGGFLEGVMLSDNENKLQQLPEVLEILNDFAEIKNVSLNVIDNNQNEKDFGELLEFVRVGVLLFYTSYQQKQMGTTDVVVH